MLPIAVIVAVLLLAAWLTRRFCDPSSVFHILDHPNERSLHSRPTPRSGGVAIVSAVCPGLVAVDWFGATSVPGVIGGLGFALAAVSYLDDRFEVSPFYRILVHFAVASGLVLSGFTLPAELWPGLNSALPVWLAATVAVLFVVWMVNLYNFMDGMDGFAGGMAVWGFGGLAVLGWMAGNIGFAVGAAIVAAGAGGFLVFNFPPARIFMGDAGSSFLGFVAAALSLWGAMQRIFPFWAAILLFSPFIVDATFTLLRRAVRGERLWKAHRSHVYQRLVQCGWGHRKTVLWEYVLMAVCVLTAVWAIRLSASAQRLIIVLAGLIYVGLIVATTAYESHEKARGTNVRAD